MFCTLRRVFSYDKTHTKICPNFLDVLIDLHRFVREAEPGYDEPFLLQFLKLGHDPHVLGFHLLRNRASNGTVAVFSFNLHGGSWKPFKQHKQLKTPLRGHTKPYSSPNDASSFHPGLLQTENCREAPTYPLNQRVSADSLF